MQSIDSAPKDGSPVWAKVFTLGGNVFRAWIYWSSEAAGWAYASHPYDFPCDVHGWFPTAINQTMQFPLLTPESQSVLNVAGQELPSRFRDGGLTERRFCAAAIREAQRQACILLRNGDPAAAWLRLAAIADNLAAPDRLPTKEEMIAVVDDLKLLDLPQGFVLRLDRLAAGVSHYCHD